MGLFCLNINGLTWSDPTKAGDRILAPESRELILFLPPEGKGQLLFALCKSHWPFPFRADVQEDAILVILGTIQTWREYKEIMEHLSIDGSRLRVKPLGDADDQTWRHGEAFLHRFLDGAQKNQFLRMRETLNKVSQLPHAPQVHTAAVRDNGIALA